MTHPMSLVNSQRVYGSRGVRMERREERMKDERGGCGREEEKGTLHCKSRDISASLPENYCNIIGDISDSLHRQSPVTSLCVTPCGSTLVYANTRGQVRNFF